MVSISGLISSPMNLTSGSKSSFASFLSSSWLLCPGFLEVQGVALTSSYTHRTLPTGTNTSPTAFGPSLHLPFTSALKLVQFYYKLQGNWSSFNAICKCGHYLLQGTVSHKTTQGHSVYYSEYAPLKIFIECWRRVRSSEMPFPTFSMEQFQKSKQGKFWVISNLNMHVACMSKHRNVMRRTLLNLPIYFIKDTCRHWRYIKYFFLFSGRTYIVALPSVTW